MISNILSIPIIPTRRKACRTFLLSLLLLFSNLAHANLWKAYLSYYEPTEIEQASGNMLYVLASGALYSYNRNDQSLQTYDKTTVLSDCDIAHIAWCQAARRLVVVYTNGNIDLLDQNSNVTNMANYMNKSMTEDKTVYSIDIAGSYAYLSTGFGIMKVNVSGAEFSDTYQLGFKVDYSYLDGSYLYAASSTQGLYRALLTSNLSDKASWTRVGDYVARPKTMDADLLALVKTLNPGGPKYNYFGFLKMHGGKLYSCNGLFGYQPGCIQVWDGTDWTHFEDDMSEQTGINYQDVLSLDFDPGNGTHVMAGTRSGIYEFSNGKFVKLWNHSNSPIEMYDKQSQDYELVFSVMYDKNGNLWALNSQAPTQSILEYTKEGVWNSYPHADLMKLTYLFSTPQSLGSMKGLMTDSRGLVWFVNDHWTVPSFYAYQPEGDALSSFQGPFVNDDGTSLSITSIRCITEDQEHNMWIGSNIGPFMIQPGQLTATTPLLTQVKVPRNDGTNYADYLLTGVDISTIIVDKNNRKWFGTNGSGVYLIASDNITTLAHFTQNNSKLLSDHILSIAIDDNTGEVFIGTDKGLCSYTGNLGDPGAGMTKENVWAYPNPVRPDYTGAITITGLANSANVKIVTSNGTLVNEGIANNGQYKWYGLDQSGRRVASGVYMVEIATAEGEKGVVCKIAIVR